MRQFFSKAFVAYLVGAVIGVVSGLAFFGVSSFTAGYHSAERDTYENAKYVNSEASFDRGFKAGIASCSGESDESRR